jgi:hypothetical protein
MQLSLEDQHRDKENSRWNIRGIHLLENMKLRMLLKLTREGKLIREKNDENVLIQNNT